MLEPPLHSARFELLFAKYHPRLTTSFFFAYSSHALAPSTFSRLVGSSINRSFVDTLWIGSNMGVALYIYSSKHLRNAPGPERFLYCVYGSVMFNYSASLLLFTIRSIFPGRESLSLAIGLSTSAAFLFIGRRYINFLDQTFDTVRFRSMI